MDINLASVEFRGLANMDQNLDEEKKKRGIWDTGIEITRMIGIADFLRSKRLENLIFQLP